MSTQDPLSPAAPKKRKKSKKKGVSPARMAIGVVVLIAAVVIAVLEFSANLGYNHAVSVLKAALDNQESDLLSQKEVESKIGNRPSGEPVPEGDSLKMTYTWSGVFRKYHVTAYYTKTKTPHLQKYSTDADAASNE